LKEIGGIRNQSVEQITKIVKQVIHAIAAYIVCIISEVFMAKVHTSKI